MKPLALLLKHSSPTPSNKLSLNSFQRDFIAYMKVSKEKLFTLRMIEFSLLWIFIIVIKFTIIVVDIANGRQWLTTNSRQTFADDCSAFIHRRQPAISSVTPRQINWVKLLPIHERDIGQAAGSHISRPSSPLSAMNAYKSSTTRL